MPGHPDDDLTMAGVSTGDETRAPGPTATPPGARLAPGSIIAGRYRLVALLGRGGMGEVYRAEDLTLDQAVALKFLPHGVAIDAVQLARFHNELRIARQVSHKNVCRLYDLGEADGRRFLTMEYIDGEDLASLLRRIGRVPEDKAVELARQLCAGLAAAHDRGVLHRDLKPANVMIDGEGNVRITDFGLAVAAGDSDATHAGTPQYMAPEQLVAGRAPATIKSDIYALGLVLFEIFTGRRAYEAKTLADLIKLHESHAITTPSSVVRDLDPAIERIILRCLEKDPDRRPGSALAVAAALPGGDPLAAALAAGETPSPDMLAAAGETDAIDVTRGLAAVVFVVAAALLIAGLGPRVSVAGRVPLDKPPAVLADRAQQILRSFGYTEPAADVASDFEIARDYLRWVAETDQNPRRWDALKIGSPATLMFWHRTSPSVMVPLRSELRVTTHDPPLNDPGMTFVVLDTLGRLQEFKAVPPQSDQTPEPSAPMKWEALFDAAGLPLASFTAVAPRWTPDSYADTRAAWEGSLPDRPEYRVRVEAASYRGRPVSMLIVGPWARAARLQAQARPTLQSVVIGGATLVLIALMIGAVFLARYNIKARRADQRGAARIALFIIIGYALVWFIATHHVPDVNLEMNAFIRYLGLTLVTAALLSVSYIALEPYVRRFWPDGILGWSRLMSGHIRDPRVGRDILTGSVLGVCFILAELVYALVPPLVGRPAGIPVIQSEVVTLAGIPIALAEVFDDVVAGLIVGMFAVLGFVLLRLLCRRPSLAMTAWVAILMLFQATQILTSGTSPWIAAAFQLVIITLLTFMVTRYGLLVTAVGFAIANFLDNVPLTLSLSHWSAASSNIALAAAIALVCFGFYAARAGQPLFGKLESSRSLKSEV